MLSGISIWQLLIVLLIVIMIFGTKKLRGMGGDLGGAIRSFKKAMNEDGKAEDNAAAPAAPSKPLEHQAQTQSDAEFSKEHEKR